MRNGTASFSADSPPRADPNQHPIPANPVTGRQNNQGFEGMTISPNGKQLWVLLQSAAIQDTGSPISATRRNTRLLQWDLKKGKWTGEWIVQLPMFNDTGATKFAAQSELHYLDENRFLILARDSNHGFGFPATASLYRQVPSSLHGTNPRSISSTFPGRQTLSALNLTIQQTPLPRAGTSSARSRLQPTTPS
jgi:hypothetical protein